jgi:hypothetical protein
VLSLLERERAGNRVAFPPRYLVHGVGGGHNGNLARISIAFSMHLGCRQMRLMSAWRNVKLCGPVIGEMALNLAPHEAWHNQLPFPVT